MGQEGMESDQKAMESDQEGMEATGKDGAAGNQLELYGRGMRGMRGKGQGRWGRAMSVIHGLHQQKR